MRAISAPPRPTSVPIRFAASTWVSIDIFNQQKVTSKNDPTDLLNYIDKQHGIHTIEHAEKIGLGSRKYTLVSID